MSARKPKKPTSFDVINVIKDLIKTHGVKALMVDGRVQLYSGPLDFITNALDVIDNHDRAFDRADGTPALVDDCIVGQKLGNYEHGQDIYEYFKRIYGNTPEAFKNADKVMRFASREFAKACSGNIETHVCGAGIDKVFFEVELPELVRNSQVEAINDIPMQRIKDIYLTQGAYIAYREICKGELRLAQARAEKTYTTVAEKEAAKKDHKDRLKFFNIGNLHNYAMLLFRRDETIQRHGPHLPQTVRAKPLRINNAALGYQASSVQYG
ncbi:MAG TPA: hypothetical protein DCY07_04140 [Rhodospirillaceae bacterium]|nr:hypothetical protein [Rhodospirillaceae bacterium]